MKPADAGDEKLGTDALCGDELADEDLEDVAGGHPAYWATCPPIHARFQPDDLKP